MFYTEIKSNQTHNIQMYSLIARLCVIYLFILLYFQRQIVNLIFIVVYGKSFQHIWLQLPILLRFEEFGCILPIVQNGMERQF